jgi:Cohesin domain
MKKNGCGWAVLAFCSLIFASHANSISLEFSPETQSVKSGAIVTTGLRVAGLGNSAAPSIGTFDIDISFDPTILTFQSVTFGDSVAGDQLDLFGLGSIKSSTESSGLVNIFQLSLDSATDLDALQLASFTLAIFSFQAKAPGTSGLSLSVNALGDGLGEALATDVSDGSVIVDKNNTIPEPNAVFIFASGLLLIHGTQRAYRILDR